MSQQDNQSSSAPPPWAQQLPETNRAQPWWRSLKVMVPLALLVLLLAAVIFWLPSQIAAPEMPVSDTTATPSQAAAKTLESPWQEAQQAKQRRATQDILARLLDKQKTLEQAAVQQWAEPAYDRALAAAANGDELYRQRQFELSTQDYLRAEQIMDQLLARRQAVFEQLLQQGRDAIGNNNPAMALQALTTATAVDSSNQEAKLALQRAQVLAEVIALVKAADQALALDDLSRADEKLDQAQKLDPSSELVAGKQRHLAEQQTGRSFSDFMSKGFSALQNGQHQSAIAAFESALNLKPDAGDARAALTQARNTANQERINGYLTRAQQHAAAEQWQQAVAQYDKALQQDPGLVAGKIDRIKAQARLELDNNITLLLAKPLRLSDAKVFAAARQTLNDARAIAPAGSRLAQQAEQLQTAMQLAQTPVTVTLQSNNQTKVTLYRVAQLGHFEQHSLTLKPGQYVLVGSRAGYRDVRKEFTVLAQQEPPVIRIECTEPVANG